MSHSSFTEGCLTPPFAALNTDDTEAIRIALKENNVEYPFGELSNVEMNGILEYLIASSLQYASL